MKFNLVCSFFFVGLFICACKNNDKPADHNHSYNSAESFSSDLPQDFLPFYLKFFSDTVYQKKQIVFPLKMQSDGQPWTAEEWVAHKPFNEAGAFQQEFLNMNGLILETISDPKGMYKMERRYMKSGGDYNLIYFTVMNAFENSEDWEKEGG